MVKKFIFIILILLCVAPVFSQGSVTDNNGYDWMEWTGLERAIYLTGYFSAMADVVELTLHMKENGIYTRTKDTDMLISLFAMWPFFETRVGDTLDAITDYYLEGGKYLNYPINEVLLVVMEKDWWNWN